MKCNDWFRSFGKKVRETIVTLLICMLLLGSMFMYVIIGHFFPEFVDNRSYTDETIPDDRMGRMY